jgi:DNA invertase Pin-like site-specific DNA recombinase
MKIGYARTSTLDQIAGLDAQKRELAETGCERLFLEHISSVADRPQLALALDFIGADDELIVCKLDRLARSVRDLLAIVEKVNAKGASLRVLNIGSLDAKSATGRLLMTMLGAIGAFEREMMLERQREGIAKAKGEGKYKGRKPTARAKSAEIKDLAALGVGAVAIARQLGIERTSVWRILRDVN